jgi:hypothetical protein
MKEQFVTYEIALKLEELGFDEECFAYYNTIRTAIDENESIYKKSKVLFLEYDNQFNQIFPIWFEKGIVEYMWKEGSYWNGEHSRCELVGNDVKAPLWQQVIDWLFSKNLLYLYDPEKNKVELEKEVLECLKKLEYIK